MNAKPANSSTEQMKQQAAKRPLMTAAAIAAIGSLIWRVAAGPPKQ